MERKTFEIDIDAPKQKVWDTLWGEETYPKWTSAFAPGSSVETDWQEGHRAIFVDVNGDGMISVIQEKREPDYLAFRHIGEIVDGKEDLDSDRVKAWAGSIEDYVLTETPSGTHVKAAMDIDEQYAEFFEKTWPKALQHLKNIAEGRNFDE